MCRIDDTGRFSVSETAELLILVTGIITLVLLCRCFFNSHRNLFSLLLSVHSPSMLPRTLISFSLTVIFCILIFALLPLSPATPVLNAHALEDPVHRVASTKKATPQAIQDATALQEAVIDR